jgi:nucleoside-diphosphate-sugar epimerase
VSTRRIVITGGAGLVGQNLVAQLLELGYTQIVILDKHQANLNQLAQRHPQVETIRANLADPGLWSQKLDGAAVVVMLQAQIGGKAEAEFTRNNLVATQNLLDAVKQAGAPRLIHVSSSAVNSVVHDFYSNSKRAQEELVRISGLAQVVLRPTLMFGWFDRKHLGWLSRFMQKTPLFPIPGNGRYIRQPLYAGDFCRIIVKCIENPQIRGEFDIAGLEKVDYIDLIRMVRAATRARSLILPIPYALFDALLRLWSRFDRNPPFTAQQLAALVAAEDFPTVSWPELFGVTPTPLAQAIHETFNHPVYSPVVLEF